jgi:hypothetical protein
MPHRTRPTPAYVKTVPSSQGFTINSNTVIGIFSTLIGGVVLYMVTTGMSQVKATAIDVKEVKTQLPFLQHAIDATQADVKSLQNTTATKSELDNKHLNLSESLKDLKGEVKDIQHEQKQVREDLMKQVPQPKPHE